METYSFSQKYVRVRMRRFFEGQHKHVYIGRVIAENHNCLILLGRSFHFRKIAPGGAMAGERVRETSGLSVESVSERAIPWASIEFVQIIEDSVNFEAQVVWATSGNIVLDDKNKTFVTSTRDHGE
jgi:hypothetical protein